MWPHTFTVGVGGRAISIGTDDHEVVARLDRWRIPDVGEPTDYCLELRPGAPGGSNLRPLPGLYHGSTALLRTRDTDKLLTAFLRVLASHGRPPGEGQFRVALMPVVRHGAALLVPPSSLAAVSDRWLTGQGMEGIYTVSSLVDAGTARVLVDAPLGTDDEPLSVPFGGWWLPARHWDGALSPGFAVAEVMTLVTDVTADNAQSTLQAVAHMVDRVHPAFAPHSAEALKNALTGAGEPAVPR